MNADRTRSEAAGYRHHLIKPFDPEDLDGLLEKAARELGAAAGGGVALRKVERCSHAAARRPGAALRMPRLPTQTPRSGVAHTPISGAGTSGWTEWTRWTEWTGWTVSRGWADPAAAARSESPDDLRVPGQCSEVDRLVPATMKRIAAQPPQRGCRAEPVCARERGLPACRVQHPAAPSIGRGSTGYRRIAVARMLLRAEATLQRQSLRRRMWYVQECCARQGWKPTLPMPQAPRGRPGNRGAAGTIGFAGRSRSASAQGERGLPARRVRDPAASSSGRAVLLYAGRRTVRSLAPPKAAAR